MVTCPSVPSCLASGLSQVAACLLHEAGYGPPKMENSCLTHTPVPKPPMCEVALHHLGGHCLCQGYNVTGANTMAHWPLKGTPLGALEQHMCSPHSCPFRRGVWHHE